jgi:hypothetical protein
MLIDAMRERAVAESCTFTLLIPNEPRKGGADWTLKTATPLLERLATGDYLTYVRHSTLSGLGTGSRPRDRNAGAPGDGWPMVDEDAHSGP